MSSWNTNNRNNDRKEDPPLSRIFIVCSKDIQKDDLRTAFETFGEIQDMHMPKDRNTGESKGVAYIKYRKTSAAAAAIQEMHLKTVGNTNRPVKVMVAVDRNDNQADITKDIVHNRLFIVISKQSNEADVRDYFSQFGHIQSVHILKDKATNESKGLAYIQFDTFLQAAKAVEECDKKYKAIFATPKQDLKRSRDNSDRYNDMSYNSSSASMHRDIDSYHDFLPMSRNNMPMLRDNNMLPLIRAKPQNFNTVFVTCRPPVCQMYIERLFNIIPGIVNFQFSLDNYNTMAKAIITYDDQKAAAHAVESLNLFEFPSGEIIHVKPNNPLSKAAEDLSSIVSSFKTAVDAGSPDLTQLADAIAKASTLIKAAAGGSTIDIKQDVPENYCNVPLPPLKPLASPDSRVAQRCFIVCKPQPPPQSVMRDVFRCFGDLIDVSTFPGKTFGFARYASAEAAQKAIKTLHGAIVCGVRLKVLEADERAPKDSDHKNDSDRDNENMDVDKIKRKKIFDWDME